jgi:hypothetical protein
MPQTTDSIAIIAAATTQPQRSSHANVRSNSSAATSVEDSSRTDRAIDVRVRRSDSLTLAGRLLILPADC